MHALIIIDMQEASISNSDKFDVDGVVHRINKLSKRVRDVGGIVIFIQHNGTEEEGLLPNTEGWNILSSLEMTDTDTLIQKTTNDSFYNTELHSYLSNIGVKSLIICGWATDFCVDTTIKAAVSREYIVSVASDCHTVSNRSYMKADVVIKYYNWLWTHIITPNKNIQVLKESQLCC